MGFLLFILFLSVPLIEVWVLIEVGGWIGGGWTVALVVLTAVCGAALVRHQGLGVVKQMQGDMQANLFPINSVFDGACLLIAGALLLTPGFMTDTIGLALLVAPLRRALQAYLLARVNVVHAGTTGHTTHQWHTQHPDAMGGPTVIDGEFEDTTAQHENKHDKADKIEGPPNS